MEMGMLSGQRMILINCSSVKNQADMGTVMARKRKANFLVPTMR